MKNTFADGLDGAARTALDDPDVVHALQLTRRRSPSSRSLINMVFGVGMSLLLVRYDVPGQAGCFAR